MNSKERVLVTGCAGFIGMHLTIRLLKEGYRVFGIDNINSYYDPKIKEDRLKRLEKYKLFNFENLDISNTGSVDKVFKLFNPRIVVNLAAQAGVRYSIKNPYAYIKSNINGFINILECSKKYFIKGLIYASSSSVYGNNKKKPFSETDQVNKPISLYASTKLSNENMAYSYSYLFGLRTTGLRFFTVYGPWGRPDMAIYIFTKKILNNEPITVFNNGHMKRDFTYINDIVDGIMLSIEKNYRCEIFNLGNSKPLPLKQIIGLIEKNVKKKAKIIFKPIQDGDVVETNADINISRNKLGYCPEYKIEDGISNFVEWYLDYYAK